MHTEALCERAQIDGVHTEALCESAQIDGVHNTSRGGNLKIQTEHGLDVLRLEKGSANLYVNCVAASTNRARINAQTWICRSYARAHAFTYTQANTSSSLLMVPITSSSPRTQPPEHIFTSNTPF